MSHSRQEAITIMTPTWTQFINVDLNYMYTVGAGLQLICGFLSAS